MTTPQLSVAFRVGKIVLQPAFKQHDRSAGPVNGAFERRAADFDVSMPLQSHSPATRLTLDALKRLVAGRSPS